MAAVAPLDRIRDASILPAVIRRSSPIPAVEGTRDGAALETIVLDLEHQHGQALFGFVRRLGLDDTQAADAVQEALLRLWAEIRTGRQIDDPTAWAFRAIYRLAMDQHRLGRRLGALAERLGRTSSVTADHARDAGDRIVLWGEVDRLPERQRAVLYLRYRADLAFEEIGIVMGITASAARSHATQALATLRRRFGAIDLGHDR